MAAVDWSWNIVEDMNGSCPTVWFGPGTTVRNGDEFYISTNAKPVIKWKRDAKEKNN